MTYKEKFPTLRNMMATNFGGHWVEYYDWEGEEPHFKQVVHLYQEEEVSQTVSKAILELQQFISVTQDMAEEDLKKVINYDLGANINATGFGLSYHQWLKEVLNILKETS
jgi:hypothetical protein